MALYKKDETKVIGKGGKIKKEAVLNLDTHEEIEPAVWEYPEYKWDGDNWISTGQFIEGSKGSFDHKDIGSIPSQDIDLEDIKWGAANITKEDFVDEQGNQLSIMEVAKNLDPKLPNLTGEPLLEQIRDMFPKYTGAPAKEKGFLEEETAQAFKGDVYGLQKEAGKIGGAMQNVYGGGMGTSMRAGMAGQASMGKEFGMAADAYDLAKRKGMHRLEKGAEGEFEADISKTLETSWFETPEGGGKQLTDWEQYGNMREGGRVPNKDETFLNFLTQLPDAGGS